MHLQKLFIFHFSRNKKKQIITTTSNVPVWNHYEVDGNDFDANKVFVVTKTSLLIRFSRENVRNTALMQT